MLRELREWWAQKTFVTSSLDRPMTLTLRPGERMYFELDHCYVSVYNRVVPTQPDPVGMTSVRVDAKPGYVIEPTVGMGNRMTMLDAAVKDEREATDASKIT